MIMQCSYSVKQVQTKMISKKRSLPSESSSLSEASVSSFCREIASAFDKPAWRYQSPSKSTSGQSLTQHWQARHYSYEESQNIEQYKARTYLCSLCDSNNAANARPVDWERLSINSFLLTRPSHFRGTSLNHA